MLSRLFEWYRVVNAKPSGERLELREKAVREFVKVLDEASEWDLVVDSVAAVVGGFESGFAQNSPLVQAVISAIKMHDSAFPQDLSENSMELRVIVALGLGELIVRDASESPQDIAILVASLIRSSRYPRPGQKKRYLEQVLNELCAEAVEVLARAGQLCRQRSAILERNIEKLKKTPVDPAAGLTALITSVDDTITTLHQQILIDREELNILWWMFAGASVTTGDAISDLALGAAAIVCGVEFANLCDLPPAQSAEAMVRRAFKAGRKKIPKKSLEQIVEDWSEPFNGLLVADDCAKTIAQKYPQIFPLSWLAARLVESQGASCWSAEFERKTGLKASANYDVGDIAVHIMMERIAHRQYNLLDGD